MASERLETVPVVLGDGRKVSILRYEDGSIRFRISGGTPYAITEAYLQDGQHHHAIVKLVPVQITTGMVYVG